MSGMSKLEEFAKGDVIYLGPRGGKWADPKHTIPWSERHKYEQQKKEPEKRPIKAKIKAELAPQPHQFKVGDKVKLGSTRPREVVAVGEHSIVLGASKKKAKGRRNDPLYGSKYLQWNGLAKRYEVNDNSGVLKTYQPNEVQIGKGDFEPSKMEVSEKKYKAEKREILKRLGDSNNRARAVREDVQNTLATGELTPRQFYDNVQDANDSRIRKMTLEHNKKVYPNYTEKQQIESMTALNNAWVDEAEKQLKQIKDSRNMYSGLEGKLGDIRSEIANHPDSSDLKDRWYDNKEGLKAADNVNRVKHLGEDHPIYIKAKKNYLKTMISVGESVLKEANKLASISKPWEMGRSEWMAKKNIHEPYIAEISPYQYQKMSQRQKAAYDKKRNAEWEASAQGKEQWASEVYQAYKDGKFKLDDPKLTQDAKEAITRKNLEEKRTAEKQSVEDLERRNNINNFSQLKVGDKVWHVLFRKYMTVKRINRNSVSLLGSDGRKATAKPLFIQYRSPADLKEKGLPDWVEARKQFKQESKSIPEEVKKPEVEKVPEVKKESESSPTAEEKARNRETANMIYRQLGGGRFSAMIGAKNMVIGKDSLSLRFPRANSTNYMKVTLDRGTDTYNVEFGRVHGMKYTKVREFDDVYADRLAPIFEQTTGLYTSLGTRKSMEGSDMNGIDELANFAKGGGPFIGPRGGKWADAKHTIPWKEEKKPAANLADAPTGQGGGDGLDGDAIDKANVEAKRAQAFYEASVKDARTLVGDTAVSKLVNESFRYPKVKSAEQAYVKSQKAVDYAKGDERQAAVLSYLKAKATYFTEHAKALKSEFWKKKGTDKSLTSGELQAKSQAQHKEVNVLLDKLHETGGKGAADLIFENPKYKESLKKYENMSQEERKTRSGYEAVYEANKTFIDLANQVLAGKAKKSLTVDEQAAMLMEKGELRTNQVDRPHMSDFIRGQVCPECGTGFSKALTACPDCGHGRTNQELNFYQEVDLPDSQVTGLIPSKERRNKMR